MDSSDGLHEIDPQYMSKRYDSIFLYAQLTYTSQPQDDAAQVPEEEESQAPPNPITAEDGNMDLEESVSIELPTGV